MRILLWNIKKGGGDRVLSIFRELNKQNADIIVLTEYRNNHNSETINKMLFSQGYIHQSFRKSKDAHADSIMICSKEPHSLESGLMGTKKEPFLNIKIGNLYICGMHFSFGKSQKELMNDFKTELNKFKNNAKVLMVGDLDSAKNYIDANAFGYKSCKKHFDLDEIGLVDCWREKNKDAVEYSYITSNGNGFRTDLMFATKNLLPAIKQCKYIHDVRENKISNHSMMVMDIL